MLISVVVTEGSTESLGCVQANNKLFGSRGTKDDLPGAVDGYTKLGEDPSCAPPQC